MHKDNVMVRILKLKLVNFKNVEYGELELGRIDDIEDDGGNVIGIYGQNGSGKTSIIEAMSLIKDLLMGKRLDESMADVISHESDFMEIYATFFIKENNKESYEVDYKVRISKSNEDKRVYIEEERISYKYKKGKKSERVKDLLIISANEEDIKPKYRNTELTTIFESKVDCIVCKKISYKLNNSFIFSNDLIEKINKKNYEGLDEYEILSILRSYAESNFFIIDNKRLALSDANIILPISYINYDDNDVVSLGILPIGLNETSKLPKKIVEEINKNLEASNKVISEIIPGLNINLVELGNKLSDQGEELIEVELVSSNKGIEIPIRYESDGIKKIVAIIHVLITMYSHESMTILIDELDAGIFEYLLGEILYIIEERAKGQLIFTSHNLRPLEVLNKNNLVFTTTNPKNRYIKLKNVKSNTNLRDIYYRDIQLGGQDEIIYDLTNSARINRAFRKASEMNE